MAKRKVLSLSLNESEMEKVSFLISDMKKNIAVDSLLKNVSDSAWVKLILEEVYNEIKRENDVA